MKIYLVLFQYCTDDCDGVDTQAFSTYEKALERFNEIIKNEKNTEISWVGNAFENDKLQKNYELDCNETFTDGEEHELWWNIAFYFSISARNSSSVGKYSLYLLANNCSLP